MTGPVSLDNRESPSPGIPINFSLLGLMNFSI